MSIKQIYIDNANASSAAAKALKSDDFISKAKQNNAANKQSAVDTYRAGMDSQINNTQAFYDKKIADEKIAYDSEYQKNAVQKLINQKKIAETNANLGLTDSGLNRTQQTAAQLSYANQKGKIGLARQNALDNLTLAMTDAITTLQNEKASGIRGIEEKWDNLSTEQGIDEYNTQLNYYNGLTKAYTDAATKIEEKEIDAAAEVQKAQISASAKTPTVSYGAGGTSNGNYILKTSGGLLSRDFIGSLADNNINVIYNKDGTTTYVDNNSGKKTTLDSDINPYTGTRNNDADYGVFANGYQPDNVKGEKLKKVKDVIVSVKGNNQSVWYANGVYYVWDGDNNEYHQLTRIEEYRLGL